MVSKPSPQNSKTNFEDLFQSGLQLHHEKKNADALEVFKKALDLRPNDVATLTNLGIISFSEGQVGMALAYLRKAQTLKPDFYQAQLALDYVKEKSPIPGSDLQIGFYEQLRNTAIGRMSMDQMLLILALFLGGFGWSLVDFLKKRKHAHEEELALPSVSWIQIVLLVGFVGSLTLTAAKHLDSRIERGTLTSMTELSTAPGQDSAQITSLLEGQEVIVLRAEGDWTQISTIGGPKGWVPRQNLFLHR